MRVICVLGQGEPARRGKVICRADASRTASKESNMKRIATTLIISALTTSVFAAPKPCEELKAEIEAKIQAQNVSSYTLEVVSNEEVHDQNMVVGTCENGTRKIIYQKNDR
jgi:hypothetical protein